VFIVHLMYERGETFDVVPFEEIDVLCETLFEDMRRPDMGMGLGHTVVRIDNPPNTWPVGHQLERRFS